MKPNTFEFKPKSCWEIYAADEHRKAMDKLAARYLDFLTRCKTERETIDWVLEQAAANGFSEDMSASHVVRAFRGKTVFLARRGKQSLSQGLRLLGAHADAPRLDLKGRPLYEECGVGLGKTHYYGGIRKHQWLARPLALHGVVAKTDGSVVRVVLGENPADPVLTILDLLPHLAQEQMEKTVVKAFEAEKLNVVLGHTPALSNDGNAGEDESTNKHKQGKVKARILALLNERYGLVEEDLYSAELQVVPAGPARAVGLDGALLGGYGQDDRICVFAGLEAMLAAPGPEHTQVLIFWDKEEIGSEGATGAQSRYLEYCLEDLARGWSPGTRLAEMLLHTKALSADVHGALDPDYQEVHEKLNSALIGYGPCFCKFTGHRGKVGANDADAEYVGWLRHLMTVNGIPWQMAELGRVDLGGGGTVAKYLAKYGMNIIDGGPPILSMHSPFEISSKADLYATTLAYTAFLAS